MAKTTAKEGTAKGGDSNLMGAIAYLCGWLTGVIMYLVKKDDKFVKFHAIQSILLSVVVMVVFVGLMVVTLILGFIPVINVVAGILALIVYPLMMLVMLLLMLFLMWKAYQGEKFKLPLIGDFAEKNAG